MTYKEISHPAENDTALEGIQERSEPTSYREQRAGTSTACCSPAEQKTCCDPDEKAGCCAPISTETCGCR